MKKYISVLVLALVVLTSCEEDLVVYDSTSADAASIAAFQEASPTTLIFNPAADTQNVYTVSVSNATTSDRMVTVSIDPASTIDASTYSVSTLTPVIPAGQYSADIVITTMASDVFPASGSTLRLNLESVAGASIPSDAVSSYNVGFTVECPSVDVSAILGTATQVVNELLGGFGGSVDGRTSEVVAGPGENQITIVGGLGFNNAEDMILNIDPNNGNLSYGGSADAVLVFNGANPINYGTANGRALTCIGLIELELSAPFAAPFDSNTFRIQL